MTTTRKILNAVLSGRSDVNVAFRDLQRLLRAMGFSERIRGDHYIYWRDAMIEIINIQPGTGGKAKPYQVKQVRQLVVKYHLEVDP